MSEIRDFAEELLTEGFSVLPVKDTKNPAIDAWSILMTKAMSLDYAEQAFRSAWGIGLIGGDVSGGVEGIDFDAHGKDINTIYDQFMADDKVTAILSNNNVYIEKTKRGGVHLIYKYECEGTRDGSRVLSRWEDGTTMIETRADKGYLVVAPSPGYTAEHGDIVSMSAMSEDERDYMIEFAKTFNLGKSTENNTAVESDEKHDFTDPISWFNFHKAPYAKKLLTDEGWVYIETDKKEGIERWRRPGKDSGISATWGYKQNAFYPFTSSYDKLKQQCYYTPFQLVVRLRFKDDHNAALAWVMNRYFDDDTKLKYIRVATDYYKKIVKIDRFGIKRIELKPWKKDEIKQDHGKEIFKNIPKFDDFTILPDNLNYSPIINNCFNLYAEFNHEPKAGTFKWTDILLHHVFGEQYNLGLRYLQALYLYPHRMLPILVLVSKQRQTGKTTFINWLNVLFGANMVNINPDDLASSFNAVYALANIIAVEETMIEKAVTVEKLKAVSTGKLLTVNQKYVSGYKVPFFGKIILASNNEDKFAKVEEEEIRFFIRKLETPQVTNHNIEQDMIDEIPAFLHYLTTLPEIDWTRDRTGFTPDEISNESLEKVKRESKTWLYKDMLELFTELFNNECANEEIVYASPTDIKKNWFDKNSKIDINFIGKVLRDEFCFNKTEKTIRYNKFGEYELNRKIGQPYIIERSYFIKNNSIEDAPDNLPF